MKPEDVWVCDKGTCIRRFPFLLPLVLFAVVSRAESIGPLIGDQNATVTADCDVVAANPGGTVDVQSGTATFVTNEAILSVELPGSLQKGLVLWLDANKNAIWGSNLTESGEEAEGVVEWRDVRETGTDSASFAYPRALVNAPANAAYNDFRSTPPTYFDDTNNVFAGKKLLDFGEFGSKQWLYTAGSDGSLLRVRCQTFFIVGGLHGTHGHILADVSGLTSSGEESAKMFYHKGTGGTGEGKLAGTDPKTCVMPLGETRLDGDLIIPTQEVLRRNAFWLLSQNGPGVVDRDGVPTEPYFSTFFNQCNYTKKRGFTDRQGGGILGEVLVYDRVLSDSERRQVEACLNAKWFGKATLGTVAVAAGAQAVIAPKTANLRAGAIAGTGSVQIGDSQKLLVDDDSGLNEISYGLLASAVINFDQRRTANYLLPNVGDTYIVRPMSGQINRGATRTGIFRIIGGADDSSAYLDPEAIHGLHVQATNATVVLAPHATVIAPATAAAAPETPSWVGTNLIVNGGFEAQQPGGSSVKLNATTASRWTVSGNHDCAYAAGYSSVWYQGGGSYTATNHFGNVVGALQGDSSGTVAISQKIVPPVTGVYRLSYYLSRRQSRQNDKGANAPVLKVSLDGAAFHRNCVFANPQFEYNEMTPYSTLTPVLEKDREYEIAFAVDDNGTADRAVILDEIRLTPEAAGSDFIFIPGSDLLSMRGAIESKSIGGFYQFGTEGSFWEPVIPDADKGATGFALDSVWWTVADGRPGEEELDRRVVFIQKDAAVVNTVYFPKAGRVRMTLRYANRSANYPNATRFDSVERATGHLMEVSVGGRVIGSLPVKSPKKSVAAFEFDVAAAGSQELRIACVRPAALADKDVSFVFDHPAMEYVADDDLTLPKGESVDLVLTAPSNGFYAVSLPASGPKFQPYVTNGVLNSMTYYPAVATVSVDGRKLAQIRPQNDDIGPYEFRLPYLTAGDHVLTVQADVVRMAGGLRYRTPELKPLALAAFDPDGTDDGKLKTVIDLEAGAKLDLRFPGTYRVSKLYLGGVSVHGEVSAATHPDWVTGPGVLDVQSKGLLLIVR